MNRKWRLLIIILAAVVILGSVAGVALANSSQSQNSAANTCYQSFVSKLAANLGISQDTLTSALKTTEQQLLAQAVQQGNITQAQADKIESRPNGGFFGFVFLGGRCHGFAGPKGKGLGFGDNLNDMVGVLGISTSQLKTDMQSGQTLQQIVTAQGMTMQQFQQKVLALREQEISKDVAAGKITQDQANKMIQRMEKWFDQSTSSTSSGTTGP